MDYNFELNYTDSNNKAVSVKGVCTSFTVVVNEKDDKMLDIKIDNLIYATKATSLKKLNFSAR